MTKEEILSKNIEIAKFMGAHQNPQNRWYNLFEGDNGYRTDDKLVFHSDWNWLMKVVEKINKRNYVTIMFDECRIHAMHVNEFETIDIVREETELILIVFEACYEYAVYSNETINAKLDKHDKIGLPECPYCESSEYTLKNKSLDGFTYQCNNCDRIFTY